MLPADAFEFELKLGSDVGRGQLDSALADSNSLLYFIGLLEAEDKVSECSESD